MASIGGAISGIGIGTMLGGGAYGATKMSSGNPIDATTGLGIAGASIAGGSMLMRKGGSMTSLGKMAREGAGYTREAKRFAGAATRRYGLAGRTGSSNSWIRS